MFPFRILLKEESEMNIGKYFLIPLLVTDLAFAVDGVQDYMTFMTHTFQNGWQGTLSGQWTNLDDWKSEMNDIAKLQNTGKTAEGLQNKLKNTTAGYNADLLVIDTHGYDSEQSGPGFYGMMADYFDQKWLKSTELEPPDGELEITIEAACSTTSRDNWDMWYGFRNLFRRGAVVLAGCWSYCSLVDAGYNSTYNEVGDEIADSHSSIYTAWREGAAVGYTDDDIAVYGVGRVGANNCDDRARNVSMQNRNDYYEYLYGHDQAYSTSDDANEICGYYWTNY